MSAAISIFVPHAGCPFQCAFCDQRAISGAQRLPEEREIREAAAIAARTVARPETCQLAYFGGSFTAIGGELMRFYLALGQSLCRQYGFQGMRISTRPDCLSGETARLLRSYGVSTVELGAQSMDCRVLEASGRGHGPEDTVRAAKTVREAGMELVLQMMTGLPESSPQSDFETAEELARLGPQGVRIYPTLVLEHTRLAAEYRAGRYRPGTLPETVELCARLLEFFRRAEIPVVKLGLHAQEGLESRILAGPYHPALRELCEGRLFSRRIGRALAWSEARQVAVCPRDLSLLRGHGGRELLGLRERFGELRLRADGSLERGAFRLEALSCKESAELVK